MKKPLLNSGRYPWIARAADLRITVACLAWLFVLTFWGTVYQVDHGLFEAQKTFFYSWFFLAGGVMPMPGAQATLWVLFLNLLSATAVRFIFKGSSLGILIIHLGLLSYFISAFVIFVSTRESQVTLMEGESTNVSTAYHDWELVFWKAADNDQDKNIIAYDIKRMSKERVVMDDVLRAGISIQTFYPNAVATPAGGISAVSLNREPEKNIPAAEVLIVPSKAEAMKVKISGLNERTQMIDIGGTQWLTALRRTRYPLPLSIQLDDFRAEFHPGTQVAKSYESHVKVSHDDLTREVRIYMNHPLRYKNYTFFQASYSIDQAGREYSTLAVVRNTGRWLPYFSSLITFLGLAVHFLMKAFKKRKNKILSS